MKIIRDNICFVSAKDLFGYDLPKELNFDKDLYDENDYVIFTNEKDIDYVKNREDIIDYDFVSSLNEVELDKKIESIEKDLEPFYQHIKSTNDEERMLLFKNAKFINTFVKLDKVYYDLIHYRNNKWFEDKNISLLMESNIPLRKIR